MALLRSAQRYTSWDGSMPRDEGFRTEFMRSGLDAWPSVYEVLSVAERALQTYSEHFAGLGMSFPKKPHGMVEVTLDGIAMRRTPGTCGFAFADEAHRELHLETEPELRAFYERLLESADGRLIRFTASEISTYVANRLAAEDLEWKAALGRNQQAKTWLKACQS